MKTGSLIIALLGLSALATSCGEVFEAKYRGTAVVSTTHGNVGACSQVPKGTYEMALEATISDKITVRITEIKRNGDASAQPIITPLNEVRASASFSGGKSAFSSSDTRIYGNSDKDTYQISGQLSTSYDTLSISKLSVGFDLTMASECLIVLSGQFQKER